VASGIEGQGKPALNPTWVTDVKGGGSHSKIADGSGHCGNLPEVILVPKDIAAAGIGEAFKLEGHLREEIIGKAWKIEVTIDLEKIPVAACRAGLGIRRCYEFPLIVTAIQKSALSIDSKNSCLICAVGIALTPAAA